MSPSSIRTIVARELFAKAGEVDLALRRRLPPVVMPQSYLEFVTTWGYVRFDPLDDPCKFIFAYGAPVAATDLRSSISMFMAADKVAQYYQGLVLDQAARSSAIAPTWPHRDARTAPCVRGRITRATWHADSPAPIVPLRPVGPRDVTIARRRRSRLPYWCPHALRSRADARTQLRRICGEGRKSQPDTPLSIDSCPVLQTPGTPPA